MPYEREFAYTEQNFEYLRRLAAEHAGVVLNNDKFEVIYARLVKRLRVLKLHDFNAYCHLLRTNNDMEINCFIGAVTTHVTHFFREPHHFDFLARECLPQLVKQKERTHKIRILSAGCSTGKEPYSIAMVLKENIPMLSQWDIKIIGVDIDSESLTQAKAGIFSEDQQGSLSELRIQKWFYKDATVPKGFMKIRPDLERLVEYKVVNLAKDKWPLYDTFDIIFCRNVVIYFDQELQSKVFNKFADIMSPDGILIIGYSEMLYKICDRFQNIGRTIYKKIR